MQAVVDTLVGGLDWIAAMLVTLVGFVLSFIVKALFFVLGLATALLPSMPAADHSSIDFSPLAAVVRYVPVGEILGILLPLWVIVLGGIGIYKAIKLLPTI